MTLKLKKKQQNTSYYCENTANTTVKTTTPLDLPTVIQAKNYNACINSATVAKVFK